MAKRPKTATVGLRLRMHEPLRRRIELAAKARGDKVSMNAEIIARLEESFRADEAKVLIENLRKTNDVLNKSMSLAINMLAERGVTFPEVMSALEELHRGGGSK